MILGIDVGNTEMVLGVLDGGELLDHWRVATRQDRTADEWGLIIRGLIERSRPVGAERAAEIDAAVIASVVPPATSILVDTCSRYLDADTLVLDARSELPVRLDVDEPLSVGADRIANTIAVTDRFARDTIVVDLGTATTFDCITSAGAFIGGVIAPGIRSGAEAIVRRTAKLPRVELEPPRRVVGRRTEDSLGSGIFYSAVSAIDGIVERIRGEWKDDVLVVATGGLAPLIGPHCRAVEHVEPFLTLYGLDLAYRQMSP